jgi:exopolyphosphatase/guanosine-5'-triphosphate,3'-diphosphate pyrophosphatase
MRVGIVDVGANTARLLVADVVDGRPVAVRETRAPIGLGDEIERRGAISPSKLDKVATAVDEAVGAAVTAGAEQVTVLVTSPGRQSVNGDELARTIASRAGVRVRLLTAAEEGWLAYAGALATLPTEEASVAVCDVGGGSAQIVVGPSHASPRWIRSIDVGSLRLTRRFVESDPPRRRELAAARAAVDELLGAIEPPPVASARATGGTARATQKLVGTTLGAPELEEALTVVSRRKVKEIERTYGVPRWRARLLPAGLTILSALHDALGVELEVSRGGLREGAALELAEHLRAAA